MMQNTSFYYPESFFYITEEKRADIKFLPVIHRDMQKGFTGQMVNIDDGMICNGNKTVKIYKLFIKICCIT